jgi:hypothetical protein
MLQKKPSALKRKHSVLQKMKFWNLFYLCGLFLPSGSGSGPQIRIRMRDPGTPSNPNPIRIRIQNTAFQIRCLRNFVCFFDSQCSLKAYTIRKCLKFREKEFRGIPRNSMIFGGKKLRKSFTLKVPSGQTGSAWDRT